MNACPWCKGSPSNPREFVNGSVESRRWNRRGRLLVFKVKHPLMSGWSLTYSECAWDGHTGRREQAI